MRNGTFVGRRLNNKRRIVENTIGLEPVILCLDEEGRTLLIETTIVKDDFPTYELS
jgi:hypothetical protein